MDILYIVISLVMGLLLGVLGFLFLVYLNNRRIQESRTEANLIIENALKKETQLLIESKEKALNIVSKSERELNTRKFDLEKSERLINEKEVQVKNTIQSLEVQKKNISDLETKIKNKEQSLDDITSQKVVELEKITKLSLEDAKNLLIEEAEIQSKEEIQKRYLNYENEIKIESNDIARKVIADSIQRLASEVVSERSVSSVSLPDEDMKGRLIGREGRNIRAIEAATGVDVLIDDTPGMVVVSSFDPIRREVARISIEKLIKDGRVQPSNIEEIVDRCKSELEENIMKLGQAAALDVGVSGLPNEIIKTIGELNYRYSYGENVLQHSIET